VLINCNFYRRLKLLIDKLKKSKEKEATAKNMSEDCCSETDTEADETDTEADDYLSDDYLSNSGSDNICFPKTISRSKALTTGEESEDDAPLMSLYQSIKSSSKNKTGYKESLLNSTKQAEQSPSSLKNQTSDHQTIVSRKRPHVILSDDDDDDEVKCSSRKDHDCLVDDLPTYNASMFSLLLALL